METPQERGSELADNAFFPASKQHLEVSKNSKKPMNKSSKKDKRLESQPGGPFQYRFSKTETISSNSEARVAPWNQLNEVS